MCLNIWALAIVKALGLDYGAAQIVFLRAITGFLLIAPFAWHGRAGFRGLTDLPLHVLRIALSLITLGASFYAVARMPFALFTAVSFTRPLVMMLLSALFLREVIGVRRWIAGALALLGVAVATGGAAPVWATGLPALFLAVITGSGAIVVTRRLRAAPHIVMMTFYAAGLSLGALPFALTAWVPPAPGHLVPLLGVGVFATAAQVCFLRAHHHGEAGFLGVLAYLSLILTAGTGYLIFGEAITLRFSAGAAIVVGAALWVTRDARTARIQ